MTHPHPGPDRSGRDAGAVSAAAAIADTWVDMVQETNFVPLPVTELHRRLIATADTLLELLDPPVPAGGQDATAARRAGAELITDLHITRPAVLERMLAGIGSAVPHAPAERLATVGAAVAAGYAEALRERTCTEQERISAAAFAARAAAERDRRASDARFAAVVAASVSGVLLLDATGRVVLTNPALSTILGRPAELLAGHHLDDVLDQPGDAELRADLRRMLAGQQATARAGRPVRRPDGRLVHTEVVASLVRHPEPVSGGAPGAVRHVVLMISDVTERHQLEETLRYRADHDPLTGLPNRTRLTRRLDASLADPTAPLGLCFLDLDGFKAVNDTLGHDVGDQLLQVIAHRLATELSAEPAAELSAGSATDTVEAPLVARTGGDEFVVVVPGDPPQVAAVARRVCAAVRRPVLLGPHRVAVTASVGVVDRSPTADSDPAELMKAADTTLYVAKAAGGDRIAHYDAAAHRSAVARFELSARLPEALERGEFLVEFQPLVRLSDHVVVAVEALVRWERPGHGRIEPDAFIALAEETGLIVPLGREVLLQACRHAVSWRDVRAEPLLLSVNLSTRQLREPGIVDDIAAVLAETGWPAGQLQLELTENGLMSSGAPLDALRALAAMGVRIAIDDFGTGYSNLAYLQALPVHAMKLAGRFVTDPPEVDDRHGVDQDGEDSVLALLVRLAHRLGLTVTAEAVETAEQAGRLRRMGCDTGQGWYFARSVPGEQVPALLRAPLRRAGPDQP